MGEEKIHQQVKALFDAGRYAEALPLARQAVERSEATHSPVHPEVAADLIEKKGVREQLILIGNDLL